MRWGIGVGIAAAAVAAAPVSQARAQDERPVTVPGVREWRALPGEFALRRDARVVVPYVRRQALLSEARVLARDLGAIVGRRIDPGRPGARERVAT